MANTNQPKIIATDAQTGEVITPLDYNAPCYPAWVRAGLETKTIIVRIERDGEWQVLSD